MTSKEAIDDLIEGAKFDLNKWELDRLGIIDKYLEVLDIIKRSIFNKEEHKYYLNEKYKGQKFMLLSLTIRGDDDIAKVKEWLENE